MAETELTEAQILDIEASYAETGQDVDWAKWERRGYLDGSRDITEDSS